MNEYSKIIAKYYDSIYDDLRSPVDLKFYLNEISKANGRVLEIGVGTGRIFLEALKRGADIYGIDVSENMLEILREKLDEKDKMRVEKMDARKMNFNKKFDLVIIPFRVLSHIDKIEDQLKIFTNVYEHLNEGGRIIFDVFLPKPEMINTKTDYVWDFKKEIPEGTLIREASITPDYVNQTNLIKFKYSLQSNGTVFTEEKDIQMRYYFRYELEHLLQRVGFSDYKFYGDFDKNPPENGKWEQVVEAVK